MISKPPSLPFKQSRTSNSARGKEEVQSKRWAKANEASFNEQNFRRPSRGCSTRTQILHGQSGMHKVRKSRNSMRYLQKQRYSSITIYGLFLGPEHVLQAHHEAASEGATEVPSGRFRSSREKIAGKGYRARGLSKRPPWKHCGTALADAINILMGRLKARKGPSGKSTYSKDGFANVPSTSLHAPAI
jgi:hypothetical protein